MKQRIFFIQTAITIAMVLMLIAPTHARDLKASVGFVPMLSESPEKGWLIEYLKALDEVYTDGKISIEVYPTITAMDKVIKGTHDFFVPMLLTEQMVKDRDNLPFAYFENLWDALFILYTNKNNTEINPGNVGEFKIETNRNVVQFFDFPVQPSDNVEASLKKVDMGRIDGYIFAGPETDAVLKKLGLKNIKRHEFHIYPAPMIVAKGPKGKEIEKILMPLVQKLRDNGAMEKTLGPVLNQHFVEW